MTVNRDHLEHFYSISCQWTRRDQRYLGALGLEFEIAEAAFTRLVDQCLALSSDQDQGWRVSPDTAPLLAIHARAFVDHATRLHKLAKAYVGRLPSHRELIDRFHEDNQPLFGLRNALHHSDERLRDEREFELRQPLYGDVSWLICSPEGTLDLYSVSFGAMVEAEWNSPSIEVGGAYRLGINQVLYRAYDITVDLRHAFENLCQLISALHALVERSFAICLRQEGIERNGPLDERKPYAIAGRFTIGRAIAGATSH